MKTETTHLKHYPCRGRHLLRHAVLPPVRHSGVLPCTRRLHDGGGLSQDPGQSGQAEDRDREPGGEALADHRDRAGREGV